MTLVASGEYRQYAVPREDRSTLVEPSLGELLTGLHHPQFDGSGTGIEFCGKSLELVRRQARAEIVTKALNFTRAYRDVPEQAWNYESLPPIILSGHQPELFHPGVWFKNFLLARLASESGGIAINFLVDNDLCRSSSIRVPARESTDAYVARSVVFDTPRDAVPWELRRLGSLQCWQDFPAAVQRTILPGLPGFDHLLLADIWPDAIEAVRASDRLGLAIAQARHRLEQRIGLETLEVSLSQMVSTRAFARFSIQLLAELPRFQGIYNSRLAHYRQAHRIRSHAHPVPALEQEHGWLEAPWWIYRAEAPKRQRMWVRFVNDQLIVSDRAGWQAIIEGRLDCDNASSQWLELLSDGICLRPRALLTTMYLRMMVADLFIHGIGGGKYDQLTDAIVREFFGLELPPIAVATATLHLPIGSSALQEIGESGAIADDRRVQRERVWQLKYHADQLMNNNSAAIQQLTARKQELLAHIPPRGEKWEWHREMTSLNRRLGELAAPEIDDSKSQLEQLAVKERHRRVLLSRDYSFCLYPTDFITQHLKNMTR